jgi:hypothetical protein
MAGYWIEIEKTITRYALLTREGFAEMTLTMTLQSIFGTLASSP